MLREQLLKLSGREFGEVTKSLTNIEDWEPFHQKIPEGREYADRVKRLIETDGNLTEVVDELNKQAPVIVVLCWTELMTTAQLLNDDGRFAKKVHKALGNVVVAKFA